jgi:hypothetical protein
MPAARRVETITRAREARFRQSMGHFLQTTTEGDQQEKTRVSDFYCRFWAASLSPGACILSPEPLYFSEASAPPNRTPPLSSSP